MANPETLFQQIYDREPSEGDRRRLLAAQKAMGLSDDDPMWSMLISFDYYSQRIADKADDLDYREKTHIQNIKSFYENIQTDVQALVDSARERAELTAANQISQQTAEEIEEKALALYEHGRRTSARRAIIDWLGGISMVLMFVNALMWHIINDYYRQQYVDKLGTIISYEDGDVALTEHAERLVKINPDDPYIKLSDDERANIQKIIRDASGWEDVRKGNDAPFPCLTTRSSEHFIVGKSQARICVVSYRK